MKCVCIRVGAILLIFEFPFPHLMASSIMYQKYLGQIWAHLAQKQMCAERSKVYEAKLLSKFKRSGVVRSLSGNISALSELSKISFIVPESGD